MRLKQQGDKEYKSFSTVRSDGVPEHRYPRCVAGEWAEQGGGRRVGGAVEQDDKDRKSFSTMHSNGLPEHRYPRWGCG